MPPDHWIRFAPLGIAIVTFAVAEGFHANGFIAAAVAGPLLGRLSKVTAFLIRRPPRHRVEAPFGTDGAHFGYGESVSRRCASRTVIRRSDGMALRP